MADDKHLEEQIRRLETLAPSFGRARPDIDAICSRGRAADYRGVLQNTRLVVETLLRAIYAKKKQTPGKQTLEQLLNKLKDDLPTNIQVHTRTIQAWGNVGAHDHSEDLFGQGVEFSRDEALASLNSLIVVLEWYLAAHLDGGASVPQPPASASGPAKPAASSSGGGSKMVAIAGGVVVLAVAGAVALNLMGGDADPVEEKVDLAPLDRAYDAAKQPAPPATCRTKSAAEAKSLVQAMGLLADGRARGARAEDDQARKLLEPHAEQSPSAELWGVLARARLYTGADSALVLDAVDHATKVCPSWAEPHNLKGNLHVVENDLDAAKNAYLRAAKAAPHYLAPRFNLGLVLLKSGATKEAIAELDAVISQDPDFDVAYGARGRARLVDQQTDAAISDLEEALRRNPKDGATAMVLGQALRQKGEAEKSNVYFCQASRLGVPGAESLCSTD